VLLALECFHQETKPGIEGAAAAGAPGGGAPGVDPKETPEERDGAPGAGVLPNEDRLFVEPPARGDERRSGAERNKRAGRRGSSRTWTSTQAKTKAGAAA
jgi:hypothetical protein